MEVTNTTETSAREEKWNRCVIEWYRNVQCSFPKHAVAVDDTQSDVCVCVCVHSVVSAGTVIALLPCCVIMLEQHFSTCSLILIICRQDLSKKRRTLRACRADIVFGVGNSLLLYPCVMSRVTKMIVVMGETRHFRQRRKKFKIPC